MKTIVQARTIKITLKRLVYTWMSTYKNLIGVKFILILSGPVSHGRVDYLTRRNLRLYIL